MAYKLGVRREDKNIWERRVPVLPEQVKILKQKYDIQTVIQPFPRRAIKDELYLDAGAEIREDLSECSTIIAIKEIPKDLILPNKKYVFFSHTIKGQKHNMPLLKKLIDSKVTLIDYEGIKDSSGRRLVFFGRFAGLSGIIETFHAIGKRYDIPENPFKIMKPAYKYKDLNHVKEDVQKIAEEIKNGNINSKLKNLIFGFIGYGNVSKGAQELFDLLPHAEVSPADILAGNKLEDSLIKTVFAEKDIVEPKEGYQFELSDYFKNPHHYDGCFEKYFDKLDIVINAIYWDEKYPRLMEKKYLRENFDNLKIDIVTDISCDINGSIEFTEKPMKPDLPGYVYNPLNDKITDGFHGKGILNIAVDNLPTELPKDSSEAFSRKFFKFLPEIVLTDTSVPFEKSVFSEEVKSGVILYNGEFTPKYEYMKQFLID